MARHFTVAEANALLSTVRSVVERLVDRRRELRIELERQQELGEITKSNGGGFNPRLPAEIDAALQKAAGDVSACIEQLTELGVQVKDLDSGLIDFPSLRDGAEILLCWQLGEDEIAWWHTLDRGFAGRRPL
jgi:hypothetical protein